MNGFTGTKVAPVDRRSKRKSSVLYASAAVYLSFLAIERIDLLQGQGSFGLTLELLGSIAFLACYLFDLINHRGKFRLSGLLSRYTAIVIAFLATVLLSVPFSADFGMSVRRILLLSIYVFSGLFSVNYLITQRPDSIDSIVVMGMVFLSIVYAVFSLYDVFMWLNAGILSRISSALPFFRSRVWTIGGVFVRVRGASEDPNRAGIFLIINTHIILQYCKRPALKVAICIINAAVLALTLSRTAALCLALYVILQMRFSKKISKKNLFRVITIMLLIIVIAVGLYQVPLIKDAVGHTFERFQTRDASADEHVSFIKTGISEAFSSIKVFLIGNGYGASAGILGRGKYSNFHNAYVTFFAECGLLSMLLFILLLFYPLRKDRAQFPIIAVLALANIPYQVFIEPYFWFLLPLVCVSQQLQHVTSTQNRSELEGREFNLL